MARPDIDIEEQFPDHRDMDSIVIAIRRLSQYPVRRAYALVKSVSAAYTIDAVEDRIILATGTTTITLPDAAKADHVVYTIVRAGSGVISYTTVVGTIDGVDVISTPGTIGTQYRSVSVASDGTNYFRIFNNI